MISKSKCNEVKGFLAYFLNPDVFFVDNSNGKCKHFSGKSFGEDSGNFVENQGHLTDLLNKSLVNLLQ